MIRTITHPTEILFGGTTALACGLDGMVHSDELHGLFAGDTRVLSTWRLSCAGAPWRMLSRERTGPGQVVWHMQNPLVRSEGYRLERARLHLTLTRRLSGALHDDLQLEAYVRIPTPVRIALQLDADFSDLFEVKRRDLKPRLNIRRELGAHGLSIVYERGKFRRALHLGVELSAGRWELGGAFLLFDAVLAPRAVWRCCLHAVPEVDGHRIEFSGDRHGPAAPVVESVEVGSIRASAPQLSVQTNSPLQAPLDRSVTDLQSLGARVGNGPLFLAAGAPWFLALFGRDTLVTSLMAGATGDWHVRGAIEELAARQATERDDRRDAQPGKIAHELRVGELARFGMIPHTPYYGTHDAPALLVLALWNCWRWTGDDAFVNKHLAAAERALQWCDTLGDADGDGLLEYAPHSPQGYYNQAWKDAGDAVMHEDGSLARHPIATVELQGYWYAARLAMAELLAHVGREGEARAMSEKADRLRALVEERFWMPDCGTYALALDGQKRVVRSIASNAGHLLWCGLPSPERARSVAARLLAPDMFSGFGTRTLSSDHIAYNPLAYQLGAVWPHDNALFAAGLVRYGLLDEASRVLQAVLEAAEYFEHQRLPELFCGMPRGHGGPVPYEDANVPQAWAAAVPVLALQLMLGLLPDAPHRRVYLQPWLPDWLDRLDAAQLIIGNQPVSVSLVRENGKTRLVSAEASRLELVQDMPAAPLWGAART